MKHFLPAGLCLAFALTVLSACLLAACARTNPPVPTVQPAAQTDLSLAATRTPAPSRIVTAPSPTPRLLIEPPIVWYLYGEPPAGLALVNDALNQALAERGFNAQVELRVITPSAYAETMASLQADGGSWDLASLDGDLYADWIERGALLPLDALPGGLRQSVPPAAWQALRREGRLYAIPNQGRWLRPAVVAVRAEAARSPVLPASLEGLNTFADIDPLLNSVHSALQQGALGGAEYVLAQPDLLRPENAGYLPLALPWVVRYDDPQARPVNWLRTPEFRALAQLRRDWQQSGCCPDEPLTPDQWQAGYREGKYLLWVGQTPPGGVEWVTRPLAPSFLTTDALLSSLTGVNAALSADPARAERAMLLLEWTHTDAQIYNLLAFGVEGRHWAWADRDRQVITRLDGEAYRPDFARQLGDQTLSYADANAQAAEWQAVRRANATAAAPSLLGFVFDPRPVLAETAALDGLYGELLSPLENGQAADIDREIERIHGALEEAGLGGVGVELERQVTEWLRAAQ